MPRSSSKDKLVSTAIELMLERGYTATGVDDICTLSGVSKGAFYHHFSSKEDIAAEALRVFYAGGLAKLTAIDPGVSEPTRMFPAWVARLAHHGEDIWSSGCLIGSLALEMAQSSPSLQQEVSDIFDNMAGVLAEMADPFAESLPESTITGRSLAEQLLSTIEGAIVLARAHFDPSRINRAIDLYARQLSAMNAIASR